MKFSPGFIRTSAGESVIMSGKSELAFLHTSTLQLRTPRYKTGLTPHLIPTCTVTAPRNHSRRSFGKILTALAATTALSTIKPVQEALAARPEGVNRPELLPQEFTTVIDLEKFLASGEARRLKEKIDDVEKRTGFKIRVLTQRYPQTPGLAIRDYWNVDDNTVVMVADYFGGSGQLLKYNVGAAVDVLLPPRFWSVLSANLGNKFYIEKNGEAASIINSVESIRTCLLRDGCATPPDLNPAF